MLQETSCWVICFTHIDNTNHSTTGYNLHLDKDIAPWLGIGHLAGWRQCVRCWAVARCTIVLYQYLSLVKVIVIAMHLQYVSFEIMYDEFPVTINTCHHSVPITASEGKIILADDSAPEGGGERCPLSSEGFPEVRVACGRRLHSLWMWWGLCFLLEHHVVQCWLAHFYVRLTLHWSFLWGRWPIVYRFIIIFFFNSLVSKQIWNCFKCIFY